MYTYKFFIEWRGENTASSILVSNFDIKNNAVHLYAAKEAIEGKIKNIPVMVIPFSSIRYFTYEIYEE